MYFTRSTFSFSVFLCSALLIMSGCGSRTTRRQVPTIPQLPLYKVYVDGVECQFCAQSVLDIVSKLPGVRNAKYHTTDATYKESHLTFLLDQKHGSIAREQLQVDLEKEGFSLVSLETSSMPRLHLSVPSGSASSAG